MLDRNFEESIMASMNKYGQSSSIIESDKENYRIEDFITNYRAINKEEIDLELDLKFLEKLISIIVVLNNSTSYSKVIEDYGENKTFLVIMKRLYLMAIKYLKEIQIFEFDEIIENIKLVYFNEEFISEKVPLVISHNDLHCGNIMINKEDKFDLKVIDFEFSSLNFIGFDIVNYFVECCIDLNYSEYPFFRVKRSFDCLFKDEFYFNNYLKYVDAINQITSFEEKILTYISKKEYYFKLLSLASTFWSLVGINYINPKTSICKNEFDYRLYVLERLKVFDLFNKYIKVN